MTVNSPELFGTWPIVDVLPRTFRARFIDDSHVTTSEETSPDQDKVENVPAKPDKLGTLGYLMSGFCQSLAKIQIKHCFLFKLLELKVSVNSFSPI